MGSLFQSTNNTRAIVAGSYRYLRSDVPALLTEEEFQWLLAHEVTTIVDLREEGEKLRKPCPLETRPGFSYHHLPVTGGSRLPESPELVSRSYIAMVDGQMQRILHTLRNAPGNALYFCSAGKDRTGVVSALLLHDMGYEREDIVADYLQSRDNLREMLENYIRNTPGVNREVITPQARYMEEFLDWLEEQHQNR